MARKKSQTEGSEIDMTPMIDVVFQLIIFFIVTIVMSQELNEDIILEDAKAGPPITDKNPRTTIIEIDRRGWLSMHGAQLTRAQLWNMLKNKYERHGEFPVLIRGDLRAKHKDIRAVMDMCSGIGVWRINFAAIKEKKT